MNDNKKGEHPPGGFTKGDPRINRKGRPPRWDRLQTFLDKFGEEKTDEGKTRDEDAVYRLWKNYPEKYIEYRYGKPTDHIDLQGQVDGNVIFMMPRPGATSESVVDPIDPVLSGTASEK
jgi:hypothetical protein